MTDTCGSSGSAAADEAVLQQLLQTLGNERPALVMCDMAPNMSGMAEVDHDRSMHLVELASDFARMQLQPGGDFLVKVFQGRGFQPFMRQLKSSFATVSWPGVSPHDATLHGRTCVPD